jgi:hypothetical protein
MTKVIFFLNNINELWTMKLNSGEIAGTHYSLKCNPFQKDSDTTEGRHNQDSFVPESNIG